MTDFFIDYLKEQKKSFFVLKHPFFSADSKFSELVFYSGGQDAILKRYKKINNEILNLCKNFCVSMMVSIKLGRQIDKIISFGSFNVAPFIFFEKQLKRNVYFWGVDYSRKRFLNQALNGLYLLSETLACKYSILTINQSPRQAMARQKFHGLKEENTVNITNGVKPIEFQKDFSGFGEVAFLYMGSITKQHGIVDFLNYFYIKNHCSVSLYIIGSGEMSANLREIIKERNLSDKIKYLGYKNQQEIKDFLDKIEKKLFGIAPYFFGGNTGDHVYYGDSLKVKEYLNYNLPYITNSTAYIPEELKKFGIIYSSFGELSESLEDRLLRFHFNIAEKKKVLSTYEWEVIFKKVAERIKI